MSAFIRPATGISVLPGGAAAAPASAIALYARATPGFDERVDEALATLREAAAHGPVTQANSLGAEDMVLTHLINRQALPVPVFVLDTGALHRETLALLDTLREQQAVRAHAPLTVYQPDGAEVARFIAQEGAAAIYQSTAQRKACCAIRKLAPLARALEGYSGWITGLRREQSGARAEVPLIDRSETATGGRTKYSPLAGWSWADVWHYIALHGVPHNALHDHFYPSIGCAPCTRAIAVGEDFRAGRWWWENEGARECGLHVKAPAGEASAASEIPAPAAAAR